MKKLIALLATVLVACFALPAFAAPLRVFVADINPVGVQNRDELRTTLQTLLSSRLNNDNIMAVASSAEADAILTGTYVVIGKIFSIDAMAKSVGGKTLTRAYVQGENQDELIPAVGKLADKLSTDLQKLQSEGVVAAANPKKTGALIRPATPANSEIIKKDIIRNVQTPEEIIRPKDLERNASGGWTSKRLPGAANLIATGKMLPDGSREIFLAEDRRFAYYRQNDNMNQLFATEFSQIDKIISLDAIDGAEGKTEVYVTIMHGEDLASQIWQVSENSVKKVAEDLPYYFRALTLPGGGKKMYAQASGRDVEFYGDVMEAKRNGSKVSLSNPVKMPRFGSVLTFNQFMDQEGKLLTVTINPDNYLVVYDQELKEVWRSNDKFGGSELYYQKDNTENFRVTNDKYRWFFMNQRIQVTSTGDVLVGKNDGFWVVGNAKTYKKGAVYCFRWNGSSLEEQWHTRDTQNYMPDYYFDETRNELLLLQTVQRQGLSTRGAASLAIKKVE